jgi:hypothetical protein
MRVGVGADQDGKIDALARHFRDEVAQDGEGGDDPRLGRRLAEARDGRKHQHGKEKAAEHRVILLH